MKSEERDVGIMGEGVLTQWAGGGGFIANSAKMDKGGWDFFVQVKRPPGPAGISGSYDHLLGSLECLVQVKSTDSGHTQKVTLSNWHRFCLSPLPAFFLILEYKGGSTPEAAYLVHVDKKWIGKAFKKMRGLSREKQEKFHLEHMRVSWSHKDKLPALNGHAFKQELERHVGRDLMAYSRRKAKWRKEVGYKGPIAQLTFSLQGDDNRHPEDLLVDFMLGVRSTLNVQAERFEEIRFGIPKPIKTSGQLELTTKAKPSGKAKLTFLLGTRVARLKCKFFSPAGVMDAVSKDRVRVRYISPFVEFMVHAATGRIDLTFTSPKPLELFPLCELAQAFALLAILEEAGQSQAPDLKMIIEHSEKSFELKFKAPRFPPTADSERELAKAVDDAWYIAKKLDVDEESKISPAQLLDRALQLRACRSILDDAPHDIKISGELKPVESEAESDVAEPQSQEVVFGYPLVAAAFIGKTLVVASAAAHGKPEFRAPLEDGSLPYVMRPELHRFPPAKIENATGRTYPLKEYYERLRDWMNEQGISMPRSFLERLELPKASE